MSPSVTWKQSRTGRDNRSSACATLFRIQGQFQGDPGSKELLLQTEKYLQKLAKIPALEKNPDSVQSMA